MDVEIVGGPFDGRIINVPEGYTMVHIALVSKKHDKSSETSLAYDTVSLPVEVNGKAYFNKKLMGRGE